MVKLRGKFLISIRNRNNKLRLRYLSTGMPEEECTEVETVNDLISMLSGNYG